MVLQRDPAAIYRDCSYLHDLGKAQLKRFIRLGHIGKETVVLEAMCGTGDISAELEKQERGKLFLLDCSRLQIERAKKRIKKADFRLGNVLNLPFPEEYFDVVFVRNGTYELPKKRQPEAYKQILKALKKGGLFLNWGFELNEKNQKLFQNIVRFKDKLAGYFSHARNRYFMAKNEFKKDLKKAGFKKIRFVDLGATYSLSTKRWRKVDFDNDRKRLEKLNDFIRSEAEKSSHKGIEIKEKGNDIAIKGKAMISIAVK